MQPPKLVRGEGCRVWDAEARSYLDLLSGTCSSVLGHAHPRCLRPVAEQAATLTHLGASFGSREVDAGLAKLAEILPDWLDRAVLLSGGSEAVELALKIARAATGGEEGVVGRGNYDAFLAAFGRALADA